MITLLTMHELHGLKAQELGELYQLFSMLLLETQPDTPDRRNILASLENLERAMGYQADRQHGHAANLDAPHSVFNVEQIEGLPEHFYSKPEPVRSVQRISCTACSP